MRRTFYFLIVGTIALIWLARHMMNAFERLVTGHPGDHALDMRFFGYSVEDVRGYFERLGPDRRKDYLKIQTRIELAFILAYGVAGSAGGIWLSAIIYNENWTIVSWLPLAGGLLIAAGAVIDLDEGQAVRKLLKSWPRLDPSMVARASKATRLKWLCLFPGIMLVLLGMALSVLAKLKSG